MSTKLVVGIAFALFGPWIVYLVGAHTLPIPLRNGPAGVVLLGLAYLSGCTGAWLSLGAIERLRDEFRILAMVLYAIVLALCIPFIGLVSVCTTGDCI